MSPLLPHFLLFCGRLVENIRLKKKVGGGKQEVCGVKKMVETATQLEGSGA
jgi:hypothetical protein